MGKVIYENRHSFYVVCGEDTDDIVGVLDAREYLRSRDHSREAVMKNCVRKPYFIPENMKAASLFSNMKRQETILRSQLMSMAEWQE